MSRKSRINRLINEWGNKCILCGEPFATRSCITREHIIPSCISKGLGLQGNIAPSHYNCNKLRADLPIIDAIFLIKEKREKIGEKQFKLWISKKVPNGS